MKVNKNLYTKFTRVVDTYSLDRIISVRNFNFHSISTYSINQKQLSVLTIHIDTRPVKTQI